MPPCGIVIVVGALHDPVQHRGGAQEAAVLQHFAQAHDVAAEK